jgi:endonuclease-3
MPAPPRPSAKRKAAPPGPLKTPPLKTTPLKTTPETQAILERLCEQHPNAWTELDFTTPFELLVATILSAQSSDKRVNEVTPAFFKRYPDARTLAAATAAELEPQIVATGFFRQKSKMLLGMAALLIERHGGEVPADMAALTALPGVGRKTANVVLGHALGVPGLPVDRHVLRVANRIGIAQAATAEEVEAQLCAALPPARWTISSDALILHGRRICRPTQPLCPQCLVVDTCVFAAGMRAGAGPMAAKRPPHRQPPRRKAGVLEAAKAALEAVIKGAPPAKARSAAATAKRKPSGRR